EVDECDWAAHFPKPLPMERPVDVLCHATDPLDSTVVPWPCRSSCEHGAYRRKGQGKGPFRYGARNEAAPPSRRRVHGVALGLAPSRLPAEVLNAADREERSRIPAPALPSLEESPQLFIVGPASLLDHLDR